MQSKHKTIARHAKRRCKERLDCSLTRFLHGNLVRLIQNNQAEFIERQSCRVTLWNVSFQGTDYRVVYDSKRKLIVTVLG